MTLTMRLLSRAQTADQPMFDVVLTDLRLSKTEDGSMVIMAVREAIAQLKADGVAYKAGTFPFMANGRARALGDTTGLVKFLAHAETDQILGVHIVGPMASELIAEAAVAMAFKASSEDIGRICHAHPSLAESMKEAALAVSKRSLNF